MSELLQLLGTSLAFLLEPGRFRIVDSSVSRSFGDASVTLQSEGLRLQLSRDRSKNFVRFQPVAGPADKWFGLGVLRRVLDGDRPGSSIIDPPAIDFLRLRLDDLETVVASDDQRLRFVNELIRAGEERADELFS